jgi:hypothetical protein
LPDRPNARLDFRLHPLVLEDELALRIDGDDSDEKKQSHCDADQDTDNEHEAVKKLLVLVAQRDSLFAGAARL